MEDINDIQLGLTKFRADSSKYFSLFDKHIPRFENDGIDRKVLMVGLGNEGMMLKCCALNPEAEYFVIDLPILAETLSLIGQDYDFSFFSDEDLDMYDIIRGIDMKFDCIIMNPPYEGQTNLYGKITLEAVQHANNVVCLSPYLNYISNKKSFKEVSIELEKHLKSIELVDNSMFDAAFDKQLCIFNFAHNVSDSIKFESLFWNKFSNVNLAKSILLKVKSFSDFCDAHTIEYDKIDNHKFKCVMTFKRGNFNKTTGMPHWDWTTLFSKEYQTKFTWVTHELKTTNCQAIPFDTEIECRHFCDYCNSDVVAFIIYAYKVSLSQSSNLKFIPFLPSFKDNIDESYVQNVLNLTNEELEYIHSEMKNFGWKTQHNIKSI